MGQLQNVRVTACCPGIGCLGHVKDFFTPQRCTLVPCRVINASSVKKPSPALLVNSAWPMHCILTLDFWRKKSALRINCTHASCIIVSERETFQAPCCTASQKGLSESWCCRYHCLGHHHYRRWRRRIRSPFK